MKKRYLPFTMNIIGALLGIGLLSSTITGYAQQTIPNGGSDTIVKYTNGHVASDPNGIDVPLIKPGDPVVWTYVVTNTGSVPVPAANVSVTDDQTGVTPVFDHEISGNGNTTFDPGEEWLYQAAGIAVDLSAPPASVKVVQGACTTNGTRLPRTAYVNQGAVTVPGFTSTANSSYCNPFKLYIPFGSRLPDIVNLGWQTAVSFEDLSMISGGNDYDYNDWITDIDGVASFEPNANNGLHEIVFNFRPHARGASYDHAFHVLIPHGIFGSDGTAVLTILDKDHNVLTSQTIAFIASADNDFMIFSKTSDVFPPETNTIESQPFVQPNRFATLDITFTNLVPFDLAGFNLGAPHGSGLFFDPYLHVFNTGEDIHHGDIRMLTVPSTTYLWPEEGVRIDKAYPDISFTAGNPPTILFPDNWWLNFNHCVYDGVPCGLAPQAPNLGPVLQSTLTVTPP